MEPKIFIELFYQMLKEFSPYFRVDVAPTFLVIALSWVGTTRAQRTSNFIRTIGPNYTKHPATYYRFFACSQWSLDLLGLALLNMIRPLLGFHPVFRIVVDDTLLKHRGACIFGASIFRDAVLSTRKHVIRRWGLNWVVLCLALPHPHYYGEFICIPLSTRLFLTEEWCEKTGATYASPSQLAVEMILFFYEHGPSSIEWRLAGDVGFTNKHLMHLELERLSFTGTIRYDAKIQQPLEEREYQGRGARPQYGYSYPKPSEIVEDKNVERQEISFTSYQGKFVTRQVIELQGTYREIGKQRQLRFLFILPSTKKERPRYLVTTDLTSPLKRILEDFVSRWCVEVGFKEAKQWMGVEKSQVWTEGATRRMAGFGFWLMGLVKVWYLRYTNHFPDVGLPVPWYKPRIPSFGQMLSMLRYCLYSSLLQEEITDNEIFALFGLPKDLQKRQDLILRFFCGF